VGQTSKGVQALPFLNCFSLLSVEEYEDNDISFSETQPSAPNNDSPTPIPPQICFSGTRWQWKHVAPYPGVLIWNGEHRVGGDEHTISPTTTHPSNTLTLRTLTHVVH
jgi:hypothetical protein